MMLMMNDDAPHSTVKTAEKCRKVQEHSESHKISYSGHTNILRLFCITDPLNSVTLSHTNTRKIWFFWFVAVPPPQHFAHFGLSQHYKAGKLLSWKHIA